MLIKKYLPLFIALLLLGASSGSFAQKKNKNTLVLISTDYGNIKLKLYNETPEHRDNFIKLAKAKFYDGTLFHRVIDGFMIQGGDPDSKTATEGQLLGNGDVGYTVPADFQKELYHKKGVLAAAREPDYINPKKASSGCQFYIVQGRTFTREEIDKKLLPRKNKNRAEPIEYTEDQYKTYETIGGYPSLDMEYTVFGEVVEGLDVLDKVAAVEVDKNNRPVKDIKMTVKVVKR